MIDSSKEKFRIVFSISNQEFLGWVVECYAVKEGENGNLMLSSQKIHPTTTQDFGLNEKQEQLVVWLEEIDKKEIAKKFNKLKRNVSPAEFYKKQFNEELQPTIRSYVEQHVIKSLELLKGEEVYLSSEDNLNVADRRLSYPDEEAKVYFHLFNNEDGMQYFANIRYQDETIDYRQNDSIILTEQPVWLIAGKQLLCLPSEIDSSKIKAFISKKFISVPSSSQKIYLEKFIIPLVEKYTVFAKGINVITERILGNPILELVNMGDALSVVLKFRYDDHTYHYNTKKQVHAFLEEDNGLYTIHRIKRSAVWEEQKKAVLEQCGFVLHSGATFGANSIDSLLPKKQKNAELLDLITFSRETLERAGFEIVQNHNKDPFVLFEPKISFDTKDEGDYFDLKIKVLFGEFEIPFKKLSKHIKKGNNQFVLPNGEIGIIPQEWFTKFLPLVNMSKDEGDSLILKKHHQAILEDLQEKQAEQMVLPKSQPIEVGIPKKLNAELRPYQVDGLKWLAYLYSIGCGGILADDMGLGKTIQVIAFLGHLKEEKKEIKTHLILAPTSLVYNWQREIERFYPSLKIQIHLGSNRDKDISKQKEGCDLVLCSYGTFRSDIEYFMESSWGVLVTDESQSYKNRRSQIHRALKSLNKDMTIGLTGTPIENSVFDLWSQMDIINPNMLGGHGYFKSYFAIPIEKKADQKVANELQKLIDPFVLRRTKKQVVKELPPKTEHTIYCEMTQDQESLYEKVKSYYRNQLLNVIQEVGFEAGRMKILAGLMKLRQIANHPSLAGYDEVSESGKLQQICKKIEDAISGNHKVLVFSQFLGHLSLIQEFLENQHVQYSYLDGKMDAKQRDNAVTQFQENEDCKVFLLSLKTGDKGLNLTAADYVIIADPWWNPAVEQQAQDRAYRIGQEKPVVIYKFISKNTIEDKIINLQQKKKSYAKSIIVETEDIKQTFDEETFKQLFE